MKFAKRPRLIASITMMLIAGVLVGCNPDRIRNPEDLPTAASVHGLATSDPLTQNAPPAPYNLPVNRFERVDNLLSQLAGWRYTVTMEFNGVFARTPREVSALAQAEVSFNQLSSARRILFSTQGELFGEAEGLNYEAVRLGRDSFLVRDGLCVSNPNNEQGDATTAAELGAGDLIGGVRTAVAAGRRATINGQEVYAYTFSPEDALTPAIRLADGGQQRITSYDLWIAPQINAVVRFYVNFEVENVVLLSSQLPVTGQLAIRYDLHDAGNDFNISVPFGC